MLHDIMREHEATAIELASVPCPSCGLWGSVTIVADFARGKLLGWICPACLADREPHKPTRRAPAA